MHDLSCQFLSLALICVTAIQRTLLIASTVPFILYTVEHSVITFGRVKVWTMNHYEKAKTLHKWFMHRYEGRQKN